MSKNLMSVLLAVVVAASLVLPCGAQTVPAASEMDRLIGVLQSDADYQAKVAACRQLSFIGTEKAVAPLAALLADEKLSHMARYGLEPMPYKAVDDALLAALGKLKGMPLVGVIGSIGVRGDARAVAPLSKLLTAEDVEVVQAAARALGSIGTGEAGAALKGQVERASAGCRWAFYEGMLRCGEKLMAAEQSDAAVALYDALRTSDVPVHVRAGAVRGAIMARQGRERGRLLGECLASSDYVVFSAAVQTTHVLAGERVGRALTAAMANAPADNQILILHALAQRDDASVLDAVYAAAKSGDQRVRLAAIKALPDIGGGVAGLIDLMFDSDGEIARAAQESFAAMSGPETDAVVLDMLKSADSSRQLRALELIGRRRMSGVGEALLAASRDDDEAVRSASISLLGDLADSSQFPVLIDLLLKASAASEIRAAERAISSACAREARQAPGKVVIYKAVYGSADGKSRANVTKKVAEMVQSGSTSITASNDNFGDPAQGVVKQLQIEYSVEGARQTVTVPEGGSATLGAAVVPDALVEQVCSAAGKASGERKAALLRVLRTTGSPRGLASVVAAAKDADGAVADEAVSLLSGWPTADALGEVLKLTESSDAKTQILALRGAIRLIPTQAISDGQKTAQFKSISPRVKRVEEKRLLLGALGQIATADALAMAAPYLDDAQTKNEASLAVVSIADALLKGPDAARIAGEMAAPLEKAGRTSNAELAQRAKALLAQAKKAAGK